MCFILDDLTDYTIPYNTYFKEGNIACDMSLGFLDKTIGDDVSTCRKRCDWNPKCMFFYYQLFGDNECVLLSSCSKYITKRSSGATYLLAAIFETCLFQILQLLFQTEDSRCLYGFGCDC